MDYLSRAIELKEELDAIYSLGASVLFEKFKDEDPIYVYIQGYTPGFNDGEPCEHSSYFYYGEDLKSFAEEYESDDVQEFLDPFKDGFNSVDEERDLDPTFHKAVDIADDIIHNYYGTDYQVMLVIGNGSVKMIKEDYECGY